MIPDNNKRISFNSDLIEVENAGEYCRHFFLSFSAAKFYAGHLRLLPTYILQKSADKEFYIFRKSKIDQYLIKLVNF